ncbi:ribonuclease T(2) [Aliiroseovarius zhejiangensis]|uniref:Ribonuclease T(2) n=1 Tax=Aliiroseovarius zhejiangensis TaxID=1632025 RepID=A0ABQ3J943_9RHOB|nr:ribonuclease T2 [Aliiroseovarius zhejiangensis]GHF05035.1 ribonuclease T(2) [Aliiroseovarius zhejiangensis]
MRQVLFGGILWLASVVGLWAEGETAGDFDYYILALSWSPNWCAVEGDARGSEQCDAARDLGWVVHGLWPQYEEGWPSYCNTSMRPPSRGLTNAQADIFGAGGAAWYQWKKHGVCAGLEAEEYYALARRAFNRVNRPEVLRKLTSPVRLPASVVEEAFLQANPDWHPDMLTITCREGRIQEARLCLTRDLDPRICARDVRTDCRAGKALLEPVR